VPLPRHLPTFLATVVALAGSLVLTHGTARASESVRVPGSVLLAQSAEELPPQMRSALIRSLQEELNAKGYGAGPVDGVTGARTRAAIRSYQRDAGLRVTGQPTKDLLDHMKFSSDSTERREAPPPAAAETTPTGDRELVRSVQRELQVRGYYKGGIDGIVGPNTRAAVRAFQRDAGFDVTGTVDQRLLTELRVADPNIRTGG